MDSPLWMRRMASDRIMLMSTVLIFGHWSFWSSWGIVLVTTTCGPTENAKERVRGKHARGDARKDLCVSAHLIDGRLLYEPRSITGKDAVCRHDVNLVSPSFLQSLGRCDKTVHIIDDVILRGKIWFSSKYAVCKVRYRNRKYFVSHRLNAISVFCSTVYLCLIHSAVSYFTSL